MSVEIITNALQAYGLRPLGQDRYRAICPACGERNPNTLSIGVTPDGAVLLKCFKQQCDVATICAAIGVEVSDLFPPRESHSVALTRRRLLSAGQALNLLHDEAQLIALAGSNIAHGVVLTDDDLDRCLTAAGRIAYLVDEVQS